MSDFGSAFSDFGGAVSDLFGAAGSSQAASAYKKAAGVAQENEALTKRSTQIQEQQAGIQTYQALGAEQADTAGAGVTAGGSAEYLLRSSASQAALTKQLTETQGEVTALGYEQQAQAYEGQAQAASTASKGQGAGGILSAVSGVASLVGWVICTELMEQGRLPRRWWVHGSHVFASYPKAVQEGYHVWAVPSVLHLRRSPFSLYSRVLCACFNWRAENIAAAAGIPGARRLWRGAAVTAFLWPLCYAIGVVRLALKRVTDWKALYA